MIAYTINEELLLGMVLCLDVEMQAKEIFSLSSEAARQLSSLT